MVCGSAFSQEMSKQKGMFYAISCDFFLICGKRVCHTQIWIINDCHDILNVAAVKKQLQAKAMPDPPEILATTILSIIT